MLDLIKVDNVCGIKRGSQLKSSDAVWGKYPVVAGGILPSCFHNQFNRKGPVKKLEIQASNGILLVTEVPATVMQGFDLERFAEDYPELAAEYAKDTTRAAYLKMTVKK